MRQVASHPLLRAAGYGLCLALASVLSACYAALDWRALNAAEGGFAVLMPARSRQASSPQSGGATLTMWTAQAGGAVFGAGFADHADDALAHFADVREGLARNIRGKVLIDRETQAKGAGALVGRELVIQGTAQDGTPREIHARLYAKGTRLYQLAVIAKPGALSEEDIELFLGSFQLK